MRPRTITDDGKTWCSFHARLEPVEDFYWNQETVNGSVYRRPRSKCKLAEQTIKDQGKEADPALAAITSRAKELARDLSKALGNTVGYKFVLIELNWQGLVPILRALLGADGICLNCGRHRGSAREYHIEHRCPPEHLADWATQHARNLWLACAGCNMEKGRRDADREWLEREQRKWMIDRNWHRHAGEKGWPLLTHLPDLGIQSSIDPGELQLSLLEPLA